MMSRTGSVFSRKAGHTKSLTVRVLLHVLFLPRVIAKNNRTIIRKAAIRLRRPTAARRVVPNPGICPRGNSTPGPTEQHGKPEGAVARSRIDLRRTLSDGADRMFATWTSIPKGASERIQRVAPGRPEVDLASVGFAGAGRAHCGLGV